VLVDLKSDQMYSLNRTGARAWELLSEGEDVESVEAILASEFDVDRAEARRELESLLEELARVELVIEA
jgi:coenzyme PQQ synthesis protein D (PqqD)